ncbi:hypothetical protein [Desertivirga brevis]|uniref:hypothetical protein n=1 Tax=Desertivirga brevis TaxID=2810310 RepID=UPI001A96CC51|nr:hypothetical protein [Pedobacter sp. SYSU D00873]
MITRKKRQIGILIVVGLLLLIPFIAMQFTSEVKWDPFDFLVAALLLLVTGFGIDLILTKFPNRRQRMVLCAVLLLALMLVWAELAVGLFGSPISGS